MDTYPTSYVYLRDATALAYSEPCVKLTGLVAAESLERISSTQRLRSGTRAKVQAEDSGICAIEQCAGGRLEFASPEAEITRRGSRFK